MGPPADPMACFPLGKVSATCAGGPRIPLCAQRARAQSGRIQFSALNVRQSDTPTHWKNFLIRKPPPQMGPTHFFLLQNRQSSPNLNLPVNPTPSPYFPQTPFMAEVSPKSVPNHQLSSKLPGQAHWNMTLDQQKKQGFRKCTATQFSPTKRP